MAKLSPFPLKLDGAANAAALEYLKPILVEQRRLETGDLPPLLVPDGDGVVLVPDMLDLLKDRSWEATTCLWTQIIEGFVKCWFSFFLLGRALPPAPLAPPLTPSLFVRRLATPAQFLPYASGGAADFREAALLGGVNSIAANLFCQMALGKLNSDIVMPEASCLAERYAHPLSTPDAEAAHFCFAVQHWYHRKCHVFTILLAFHFPCHACLLSVSASSRDSSLVLLGLQAPDPSKFGRESDKYKRFVSNGILRSGLRALKSYKAALAGDDPVGGTFAAAGEEHFYPVRWSAAGMKAAFDCTNPTMPFFPFAATSKVRCDRVTA